MRSLAFGLTARTNVVSVETPGKIAGECSCTTATVPSDRRSTRKERPAPWGRHLLYTGPPRQGADRRRVPALAESRLAVVDPAAALGCIGSRETPSNWLVSVLS